MNNIRNKVTQNKKILFFNLQFGFTVSELVVVISVIGILATIGILSYGSWQTSTATSVIKSDLSNAAAAMENYRNFNKGYPTNVLDVFKASPDVELTTVSSDTIFCISAKSTKNPSVGSYYVDQNSGTQGAKVGSCTYTLTTNVAVGGGGTVSPNGTNSYTINSTVSITATPASASYSFNGWSGSCIGMTASITVIVDSNKTCTASFISTAIAAPSAPVIVNPATSTTTTTTWSWAPAINPCPGNITQYQYDYFIDNVSQGTPSGWKTPTDPTATSTIPITTGDSPIVHSRHTYAIKVRARCHNNTTNIDSDWSSDSNTVSYYRPLTWGTLVALTPAMIVTGTNPVGTVISPDGKSAYTANSGSNTISMYSRNTSTGALVALTTPTITTGSYPHSIAISPDGKSVYVTNYDDINYGSTIVGTISMYSRDTSTGILSALTPSTISTPLKFGLVSEPCRIAISSDGISVYVQECMAGDILVYSRNTSTGALTALANSTIATGASGLDSGPIIVSPDNKLLYATISYGANSMYSRNLSTGALTIATGYAGYCDYSTKCNITISPDGNSTYATNNNSVMSMYSRNTSTGVLTALSPATIATVSSPWGVAISPDGTSVYAANISNIYMYYRNTTTGTLTALTTPTIATTGGYITISPDGKSVYITSYGSNTISMYSRN